jgi:predicted RNA binding protein YcfA (HicA-like mRNA interferase family)
MLPVVRANEVLGALLKAGFYIHHQTGSHARLLHKTRPELRVTLAIHPRDVPRGTLRRILSQADLSEEDFLRLLKR